LLEKVATTSLKFLQPHVSRFLAAPPDGVAVDIVIGISLEATD